MQIKLESDFTIRSLTSSASESPERVSLAIDSEINLSLSENCSQAAQSQKQHAVRLLTRADLGWFLGERLLLTAQENFRTMNLSIKRIAAYFKQRVRYLSYISGSVVK